MARAFNGSSDYIEFDAPATAYPITICAMMRPASITVTGVLMALGNNAGSQRMQLTVAGATASDPFLAGVNGEALGFQDASINGYTQGDWQFVAGVFTNDTTRAARLGTTDAAGPTGSRPLASINKLTIGARYASGVRGAYFVGDVAEVAVYSAALSAQDLDTLFRGFSATRVKPQSLVLYAPLIRDIQDVRGGRAATVSGTIVADHPRIYR